MVTETKEMIMFVTDLMPLLEEKVLQQANTLSLKQACLIGAGFGTVYGSEKLFKTIENIVADNYSNIDIAGLRMVLHGLVFNERISKNLLKALRMK
jgi:hypothetical protein